MKGPDIVLGIRWLQQLGKVTHDYSQQTMKFTWMDHDYKLQGDDSLRMKQISLRHMWGLLEANDVYGVYELYSLTFEEQTQSTIAVKGVAVPPEIVQLLTRFESLFRHFIKDYAIVAAPLTSLLQKHGFQWGEMEQNVFDDLKSRMSSAPILGLPNFDEMFVVETDASDVGIVGEMEQKVFDDLKSRMSSAPILGLPNFDEMFVVETDASDVGIGAVLLQNGRPLSYFSHKLGPRMRIAATYQKELFAIVEAVYKWRQYLLGRRFTIRTDHRSLKELMQQVIQTPLQQKYVRKLMGFDFAIEYKPGVTNQVADALSRMFEEEDNVMAAFMTLSQPLPGLISELRQENEAMDELQQIHQKLDRNEPMEGFRREQGLIVFRDRYYIGSESKLKELLLSEFHNTPTAGHSGTKYSTQAPGGLLQPLPTPSRVWEDVSMDFITGLPVYKGLSVIFVVVDRFTKYAHFGPLPASFNAPRVADVFIDMVVKHHGIPKTIVSDRDPIFVSTFWKQLFAASGTQLNHSTAYHPQTDGQTEVVNRGLEQYLRAMVSDQPQHWVRLLPWAEYSYNTSFHSSIGMTPYQAVYGRVPPAIIPYPLGSSKVAAVEESLVERDTLLRQLKHNLLVSKHRMEVQANRKRRDVEFKTGDMVLVKLQPYRQVTLAKRHSNKLAKRYYGPFKVLERVGKVAYRLALPDSSKIHPVFHVSLLKPFSGTGHEQVANLPEETQEGQPMEQPLAICNTRIILRKGIPAQQVLVQWSGRSPEEATWEWLSEFKSAYPSYHLEDKVISEGEGNVTPHVERRPKRAVTRPGWQQDYVMG
ncbi:ty3-gypsy retrotransposon protein [Tanacetum coccineum]|uniref:Ty3-gypsy retrotransposon protein n=1 Tax=Tanacetum coccineum TaxID=301880 RepID=A0ABQ5JCE8_9ASTR